MRNFEQVFHHFSLWEEMKWNMWGAADNKQLMLEMAIDFTGDHKRYGEFMIKVAESWKFSCENALTDPGLNKRAWIGHAACALAIGCPEDITRKAWGRLSNEQQLLANAEADKAIRLWSENYIKSKCLHRILGK